MKLRCQWKGAKCPPYAHEGIFEATNKTLKLFEPDLKRCANCTAYAEPKRADFHDDLLQIATITLWKKGPGFDPNHEQGACFRTYILPQICGALTTEKKKECKQCKRFVPTAYVGDAPPDSTQQEGFMIKPLCGDREDSPSTREDIRDVQPDFVNDLAWELWQADFERELPQLLKRLTPRQQEVFGLIRKNRRNCAIATERTSSQPVGKTSENTDEKGVPRNWTGGCKRPC